MKKLIVILIMLLFPLGVQAFEPPDWTQYSAVYTADQTAIVTGAGYFYGIAVMTDGTNPCTIETHDNTANSGANKLHPDWVVTTSATERAKVYSPPSPIAFSTGLSVDITLGAGSVAYQVFFRTKN